MRLIRFAELFGNSPQQLGDLLFEILMMTEDTKLEITKVNGEMIVRREYGGKSKIIRLPASKEITE